MNNQKCSAKSTEYLFSLLDCKIKKKDDWKLSILLLILDLRILIYDFGTLTFSCFLTLLFLSSERVSNPVSSSFF